MARNFGRMTINDSAYMHYDVVVVDRSASDFVFGSLVASDNLLKAVAKDIKKKVNCYVQYKCHAVIHGKFDVEKVKQPNGDFAHMIIKKQDVIDKMEDNELYTFYILARSTEEFEEVLFNKLYENTAVPVLREWMPYVMSNLQRYNNMTVLEVYHSYEEIPFTARKVSVTRKGLLSIIQDGLRIGAINIDNQTEASETMNEINGLDMYLNVFGDVLATKIQEAFVPKFDPRTDEYSEYVNNYDDSCHYAGIEIYEAQKAVIQSVVNNLDKNKTTIVCGEMGVGKSLLSAGAVYAHYRKKAGSSTVVLCPGHLVVKWKREIERLVPNAKGYIVENIKELIALEDKITNKFKREHTFVIISKENAKFSYETKPAVLWSKSKKAFVCPECGQKIRKTVTMGEGRNKYRVKVPVDKRDFAKEYSFNMECDNEIRVFDTERGKWTNKKCGAKLWTPLNREDKNSKWVKLGTEGWLYADHILELHDEYFAKRKDLNKKEQGFLLRLIEKKEEFEENGRFTSSSNGVRKYSIAKYIRERHRGDFDYLIADELNLMAPRTVMCA